MHISHKKSVGADRRGFGNPHGCAEVQEDQTTGKASSRESDDEAGRTCWWEAARWDRTGWNPVQPSPPAEPPSQMPDQVAGQDLVTPAVSMISAGRCH